MLAPKMNRITGLKGQSARRSMTIIPKAHKEGPNVVSAGFLASALPIMLAAPARAENGTVDNAVDSVVNAVKAAGGFAKSAYNTAETGFGVVKQGYDVAAPVVTDAFKTASPYVQQAFRVTSEAADPAIKALLPQIQGAEKQVEGLVPSDVSQGATGVTKTFNDVYSAAAPTIQKTAEFLASKDPLTLGEYAVGAVAFAYLAPAILGSIGNSLKGYSADLPAAAALTVLLEESNVILIDVRTTKEKESSGVPDLPSSVSGKLQEVEFAITEDKKLRGQLRNVSSVEAEITALQVAALKKVNKGTKVLLLDRNGGGSRAVAKELARKGYGRVFVIDGGFDGRNGWVQSKLQIKPAASLLSLSRAGPSKTTFSGGGRGSKALPPPSSRS